MRARARISTGALAAIAVAAAGLLLAWPGPVAAHDGATLDSGPGAETIAPAASGGRAREADFRGEAASSDARRVADWVVEGRDNQALPFVIIDKLRAKVFVFDGDGRLRGATLALLGRARGDESAPGVGKRKLHAIRPAERTTPAGRFVASPGRDFQHDVLWIDYDDSISMHRVVTGDPGDHRLQRLSTTSAHDKRISYGCINVPAKFYDDVVISTLGRTDSIVYILPEVKSIREVFAISDVDSPGSR